MNPNNPRSFPPNENMVGSTNQVRHEDEQLLHFLMQQQYITERNKQIAFLLPGNQQVAAQNINNEMRVPLLQAKFDTSAPISTILIQQQNYLRQRQLMNHLIGLYAQQRINFLNQIPVNQNHSVTQNLADSSTQMRNSSSVVKEESQQQFQPEQLANNQKNSYDFQKEFFLNDAKDESNLGKLTIVKEISHKNDLEQILAAIVENMGIQDVILINLRTQILQKKPELSRVFDLLLSKYQSQKKSREEIIKYIMRKAFKFLFISVQKNSQDSIILIIKKEMSLKKVTKICLDHYFQDQDVDQQVLILPFRKNSNIKTMNTSFLEKIFSSSKFVNDYKIFLSKFEEIIMKDNQNKISNIAQNIQKLIFEDQSHKIKTMRRMPWTVENLRQGRDVAEKLLDQYKLDMDSSNKLKKINI